MVNTNIKKNPENRIGPILSFEWRRPISFYTHSTVVKTGESWFRGHAMGQDELVSQIYLNNFHRAAEGLSGFLSIQNFYAIFGADEAHPPQKGFVQTIRLPKPRLLWKPLGQVARKRTSSRSFSGKPLTLLDLSTLLHFGNGYILRKVNTSRFSVKRATAAAGGLYTIGLHVIVQPSAQLPFGIFRYLPYKHALGQISNEESIAWERLMLTDGFTLTPQTVFLAFSYNLLSNSRKYGENGLAFGMMEAGAISHAIALCAASLGIKMCELGCYRKSNLEKLCSLDGRNEHLIHAMVIGR